MAARWVYILPKATFVQNPPDDYKGQEAEIEQWASPVSSQADGEDQGRAGRFSPSWSRCAGHDMNGAG